MKPAAKSPAEGIRQRQGAKIRSFRKVRVITQQQLADELKVTKAAVSEWERGKASPRPHHQVALAKALGAPWSALFGLDEEVA